MYTPISYIEQISSMVQIPYSTKNMEAFMNQRCTKYFSELIEKDRAKNFCYWVHMWNKYNGNLTPTEEEQQSAYWDKTYFEKHVGLMCQSMEDYYHQGLSCLILHDWSRNKRVYKIEESVAHDFCVMKIPDMIPVSTLTKLPSKCFYIDYNGSQHFCEGSSGCFVSYDIYDDEVVYDFVNIIEHKRLIPIHTNCTLNLNGDAPVSSNIDAFREMYSVELEDGTSVDFYEREFIRFMFNFCIYLNAANANVEYTERTKQIYKPLKQGKKPTNRMREIEEFGVGFRYSTPVSMGRTKVKSGYVSQDGSDEERQKRPYSSNYRSAHWHSYWVNDKDNPGQKVLIIKWLKETFVRGNIQNDNVTIHKVTK